MHDLDYNTPHSLEHCLVVTGPMSDNVYQPINYDVHKFCSAFKLSGHSQASDEKPSALGAAVKKKLLEDILHLVSPFLRIMDRHTDTLSHTNTETQRNSMIK